MKTKLDLSRFFDDSDKKFAKAIKLTKEEFDLFDKFEWEVLCGNGLRQINGGYAKLTIYDAEYEYDNTTGRDICTLICEVECGEQDCGDGHSNCERWKVTYNRNTKKFKER